MTKYVATAQVNGASDMMVLVPCHIAVFSEVLFGLDSRSSTPWPEQLRALFESMVVTLSEDETAQFAAVFP